MEEQQSQEPSMDSRVAWWEGCFGSAKLQGEPTGLELALNACLQELFDTRFRELQAGWSSGKLLI